MEREKKIKEDGKIRPQTSVNIWGVVCSMPRSRIPMFSVGFGLVFFFFVQFHCPQWGFNYQLRVFRIFDWVNVLLVLYAYIGMLHLKKNVNSSRYPDGICHWTMLVLIFISLIGFAINVRWVSPYFILITFSPLVITTCVRRYISFSAYVVEGFRIFFKEPVYNISFLSIVLNFAAVILAFTYFSFFMPLYLGYSGYRAGENINQIAPNIPAPLQLMLSSFIDEGKENNSLRIANVSNRKEFFKSLKAFLYEQEQVPKFSSQKMHINAIHKKDWSGSKNILQRFENLNNPPKVCLKLKDLSNKDLSNIDLIENCYDKIKSIFWPSSVKKIWTKWQSQRIKNIEGINNWRENGTPQSFIFKVNEFSIFKGKGFNRYSFSLNDNWATILGGVSIWSNGKPILDPLVHGEDPPKLRGCSVINKLLSNCDFWEYNPSNGKNSLRLLFRVRVQYSAYSRFHSRLQGIKVFLPKSSKLSHDEFKDQFKGFLESKYLIREDNEGYVHLNTEPGQSGNVTNFRPDEYNKYYYQAHTHKKN